MGLVFRFFLAKFSFWVLFCLIARRLQRRDVGRTVPFSAFHGTARRTARLGSTWHGARYGIGVLTRAVPSFGHVLAKIPAIGAIFELFPT